MRFKTVFLVLALATLIKAGVALSDDDGNKYKEFFDPLPCIYTEYAIIVSDDVYFPDIAENFENNCVPVYLRTKVYSRFLYGDDDNGDDDEDESSLLSAVNEAFEIISPKSALVCKFCENEDAYIVMSAAASLAGVSGFDFNVIHTEIAEGNVQSFKLKHIYELFPSGPGKGACKMSGQPKPIPIE